MRNSTTLAGRAFVVTERYRSQEKAFSGLKSNRYQFMAMFRGDSEKPFIAIDQVVMKILAASYTLNAMRDEPSGLHGIGSQEYVNARADRRKLEAVIWYMPNEDAITPMVEQAVAQIAAIIDIYAKEYVKPYEWWEKWKAFAEGK